MKFTFLTWPIYVHSVTLQQERTYSTCTVVRPRQKRDMAGQYSSTRVLHDKNSGRILNKTLPSTGRQCSGGSMAERAVSSGLRALSRVRLQGGKRDLGVDKGIQVTAQA